MVSNKVLIFLLWLSLAGSIAGLISFQAEKPAVHSTSYGPITEEYEVRYTGLLANLCAAIFLFIGIYLLIRNGTFGKSKEYRLTQLATSVCIIGILFNSMHWMYGGLLLIAGFSLIVVFYTSHFWKKKNKNWIDWGKWIFVVLFFCGRIIAGYHWPYGEEIMWLSWVLFVIVVFRHIQQTGLANRS